MAEQVKDPVVIEDEDQLEDESFSERFMDWVRTEAVWYAGSFTVHLLGLSLLLLMGNISGPSGLGDAVNLEAADQEPEKKEPERFDKFDAGEIEDTPPVELDVDPTLEKVGQEAQTEEINDKSEKFEHKGGGMTTGMKDVVSAGAGVLAFGPGAKVTGPQGTGVGVGLSKNTGTGGEGTGFGTRGSGHRKAMLAQGGGTKHTERAVTMALIWLANHQLSDGSWSLQNYTQRCIDGGKACTGQGAVKADAGATGLGLLPFLAAGQTHKSKGPYKNHIGAGINWLVRHQQADSDLAKDAEQPMYSHGLATIALCEAYGLSGDPGVGKAAQLAVNYILNAQNAADGGWRYHPKEAGDTSVVGWQLMALKSAHMAGLNVGGSVFSGTSKWLDSVSIQNGTEYGYQPAGGSSPTMSSVGLLCRQYLGAKRDNPMLVGGMKYLMDRLPKEDMPNIYYWYYATQVMHNMGGYDWDTWNRKMRDLLVHTQIRDNTSCAFGSWPPPTADQWATSGGRVMSTALSALTLEIYYRYLPLFKAEAGGDAGGAGAPVAKAPAAAKDEAGDKAEDPAAKPKAPAKGAKAKAAK